MAMSIASSAGDAPLASINTTPLIDVMLVLLIMIIITLPLMTHVTKLDLPTTPGQQRREIVNLVVDFDGTVLWNGSIVRDLAQLERFLRGEAARGAAQPELHVLPDKRASYDTVAKVLALAQRNGVRHIGIVGSE